MSKSVWIAAALLALAPQVVSAQDGGAATPASEVQARAEAMARMKALESQLHPQTGVVAIPAAKAKLNLGQNYYFLPAAEAKRVLTEGWGNPPDAVDGVLGMVLPAGKHFYDETWGAVVEYQDSGHVDDKDAASQDYDKVLSDMREGEDEANKASREQGYAGATLVGWAQAPTYDPVGKTLIWARNIKFDNSTSNTLNYDVRNLGRTGVLSVNLVDSMDHLPAIRTAARALGSTVQFDSGARYADFDKSTDRMADYGLAGLVAAGAGLVVAKKVGLLGVLLLFLKKGLVVLVALLGGIVAWFKRKFGKGDEAETAVAYEEPAEEPAPGETR